MHNEGELLEKYGIQVRPITLQDLKDEIDRVRKSKHDAVKAEVNSIKRRVITDDVSDEMLGRMAYLKLALMDLCDRFDCNSAAIQCWGPFQKAIGVGACTVNSLLAEECLPVACETDIHGAISSVILQAAGLNEHPVFFADLTIRHPNDDNAELLWHCGNFPPSLSRNPGSCVIKCIQTDFGQAIPAQNHMELKHGAITICRFDGDHGEYELFAGEGHAVEGPQTPGSYVWMRVNDWPMWEEKLVTGPYVHHCAGIHARVTPILYEACKYLGIKADLADPTEGEVKAFWRGR